MKVARSTCVFLAITCIVQAGASPKSRNPPSVRQAGHSSAGLKSEFAVWSATERRFSNYCGNNLHEAPDPSATGIREDIPGKYLKRYQQWKKEFLSTETGYRQWQTYAQSTDFLLTITFNRGNRNGGETEYKWNGSGKLVAATITLGGQLDQGYPNPIYYPVMNSLSPQSSYTVSGNTLAATKLAHEFGHLIRMMVTDPALYRLQNQLIPAYNQIFLSNGRNTNDPRLVDLAHRMGGTPVDLWADREYWGEANAMLFLRDRFIRDAFVCTLIHRIKRSVELYARDYAERFEQVAESAPFADSCGW
jgi:YD repeat-containing protein